MYSVIEVQDAILEALAADSAIAGYCSAFEPLSTVDEDELKQIFLNPPGIGVITPGGTFAYDRPLPQSHTAIFSVICFARNLRSPSAAVRGGTDSEQGLYTMIEDCQRVLRAGFTDLAQIFSCKPVRWTLLHVETALGIAGLDVEIAWGDEWIAP